MIKNQVHLILSEYGGEYGAGNRPELYPGVLRLTLSQSTEEQIESYLQQADLGLSAAQLKQISIQLNALQGELLPSDRDIHRPRRDRDNSGFNHRQKQHRRTRR